MKTRVECVKKLKSLMDDLSIEPIPNDKFGGRLKEAHHFGYVELRHFLDWMYDGEPKSEDERLMIDKPWKK